jgi:hypothetical protein
MLERDVSIPKRLSQVFVTPESHDTWERDADETIREKADERRTSSKVELTAAKSSKLVGTHVQVSISRITVSAQKNFRLVFIREFWIRFRPHKT